MEILVFGHDTRLGPQIAQGLSRTTAEFPIELRGSYVSSLSELKGASEIHIKIRELLSTLCH